jgi:hypothetical protein
MSHSFRKNVEIKRLSDLKGYVLLETPKEALAFVRLKTSLKTYTLWPIWEMEIVNPDQIDVWFCIRGQAPGKGSSELSLRLRWHCVQRTAATSRNWTNKLFQVDGNYEIRRTLLRKTLKHGFSWSIPVPR